jgi:hypothetical protein
MGVFTQPAMPGDLEQVSPFSWVRHKDSSQKIAGMRCDIFGEGQRSRNNVFVEKVDVVAFRIGWIVVEGEIACQHRIL